MWVRTQAHDLSPAAAALRLKQAQLPDRWTTTRRFCALVYCYPPFEQCKSTAAETALSELIYAEVKYSFGRLSAPTFRATLASKIEANVDRSQRIDCSKGI